MNKTLSNCVAMLTKTLGGQFGTLFYIRPVYSMLSVDHLFVKLFVSLSLLRHYCFSSKPWLGRGGKGGEMK